MHPRQSSYECGSGTGAGTCPREIGQIQNRCPHRGLRPERSVELSARRSQCQLATKRAAGDCGRIKRPPPGRRWRKFRLSETDFGGTGCSYALRGAQPHSGRKVALSPRAHGHSCVAILRLEETRARPPDEFKSKRHGHSPAEALAGERPPADQFCIAGYETHHEDRGRNRLDGPAGPGRNPLFRSEAPCQARPAIVVGAAILHTAVTRYITGGTVMPITASTRSNSRRTTAVVASKDFFRRSFSSIRMGWR